MRGGVANNRNSPHAKNVSLVPDEDKGVLELQRLLYRRFGIDVSHYGAEFLKRRVVHRLESCKVSTYAEYLGLLMRDAKEHLRLVEMLSIQVTEFFRDPEIFKAIEKNLIPKIIERKKKNGGHAIKAWSAGCATGEEAYTLAMVIDNVLRETKAEMTFTVSATDVNSDFLLVGKKGDYPKARLTKVPAGYMDRYLKPNGATMYSVVPELKPFLRFFRHDLASKYMVPNNDLILCRNVLIYMSQESRAEIQECFHGSLNPGGFFVLGSMEAILKSDYFETADISNCIYQRIEKK